MAAGDQQVEGDAAWPAPGDHAPCPQVFGLGPVRGRPARRTPPMAPRRLALFGVSPAVAEPVILLAELLGWDVVTFPAGPAVCPPARLCLAMLPGTDGDTSPLVAWSPNPKLNERISTAGRSILDHPPCIAEMETMLLSISADM